MRLSCILMVAFFFVLITTKSLKAIEVNGSWVENCAAYEDESGSEQWQINFNNSTYLWVMKTFSDQQCKTLTDIETESGTYTFGRLLTIPEGAQEIDFTIKKYEIVFYNQEEINELNSVKWCGYNDWTLGVSRDVTGKQCSEDEEDIMPNVGEKNYDIVKLDVNSLFFGANDDDHDGTSVDQRPVSLENVPYFKKLNFQIKHVSDSDVSIVNFHEVNDNLYRSGRIYENSEIDQLKKLGVKTILSLDDYGSEENLLNLEKEWSEKNNIELIWKPMSGVNKPTLEQIYTALDIITDSSKKPVLVHCKRGSDRTGIVIAAYRIKYDHKTVEEAKKELRSYGHSRLLYWWDDILEEIR